MGRPIRRLLIANRGEIVRRVARTASEMGIISIGVHSDTDAASPHVAACDLAIGLGGARSEESYLRSDLILDAAARSGADAIHPGYGFLSEDAAFAEACLEAGLTWIGPPPSAMRAMAGKIGAKDRAAGLGVPLLPGAALDGDDPNRWSDAADSVGYPLLIKASAGGGGRGMRVVRSQAEVADAVAAARREAMASFGDGTVFLERYLESPRHVEVQVFGDEHGTVVHLFERECSIQRRHQKVIEEATSPAVSDALRSRLTEAATNLAAGIGYVGAGTVEFLVDGDDFAFLEMNTRLQVEHPVTEAVTGLDLVRLQIEVAEGRPLGIDQAAISATGHAIEARLYAEDVPGGFLPAPGTIHRYERADLAGIRYDDGVESGTVVSPHYDPMVAKVIAHAPTRAEAALRLAVALERTKVCGLVTNRDSLVATLRHPAFLDGATTTAFYDLHPEVVLDGPAPAARRALAAAAALTAQELDRARSGALSNVPSGFRNVPSQPQERRYTDRAGTEVTVAYRFDQRRPAVSIDGEPSAVELHGLDAAGCDLTVDGVRRRITVTDLGNAVCCDGPDGSLHLAPIARFPEQASLGLGGGPESPLPGTVVRVLVHAGSTVERGDVLVVVEAMKMEHSIRADRDATVAEVLVAEGDTVEARQVLLAFEP
jgi:acetyl/propionyl-CoA carboxylase alpha subunit